LYGSRLISTPYIEVSVQTLKIDGYLINLDIVNKLSNVGKRSEYYIVATVLGKTYMFNLMGDAWLNCPFS
jgi:hypothetical protein